jgi:hypothetical protein
VIKSCFFRPSQKGARRLRFDEEILTGWEAVFHPWVHPRLIPLNINYKPSSLAKRKPLRQQPRDGSFQLQVS